MPPLKELFLIKVPHVLSQDAYMEMILPHYEFYTLLVEDYDSALSKGKQLVHEKGIQGVILCAGFNTVEFGHMSAELGPNIGVFVASGDGRSHKLIETAITNANW